MLSGVTRNLKVGVQAPNFLNMPL